MRLGRRPDPMPERDELRALVEAGTCVAQLAKRYGKAAKTVNRWLTQYGLDPRSVIPDLPGEEWRPVLGWEGYYLVSNQGRVKSVPRVTDNGFRVMGRLRQPAMQGRGNPYWQVHLMRGGRGTPFYRVAVHRLVLESFVGPCPEGMEACHNNGNGFDNRLENLRWDTHGANMIEQGKYEKLPICPTCGQQCDGTLNLKPRHKARAEYRVSGM